MDDELNAVLKAFGVLNESYFAGNKLDINEIREGIDIIRSHEGFVLFPVKTISNSSKSDHQIQSKPIKSRQYAIT